MKIEGVEVYKVKEQPNGHHRTVAAISVSSDPFWCAYVADFTTKPGYQDIQNLSQNGKPLTKDEAKRVFASPEGLWERLTDTLGEYQYPYDKTIELN